MKSVCLCGSRRFEDNIRKFENELRLAGVSVYSPTLHKGGKEWENMSDGYRLHVARGLTFDHFQKIRMADVVYIYNKDGYIGNSVTLEIGYAVALAKTIYVYSMKDTELCRRALFFEEVDSTEKLIEKLE